MAAKKSLVIVESPAKANTINKYLGSDYVVKASLGHVKDLPKSKLGVDIEHDFEPVYDVIPGKEKVIKELRTAAKTAGRIFLAADPDREGEAICQHLKEILDGNKAEVFRVLFNEITPKAIRAAMEHPGRINQHIVDAQQARRILDRLVRSEEHTSELQSQSNLVCRLLLEKKTNYRRQLRSTFSHRRSD